MQKMQQLHNIYVVVAPVEVLLITHVVLLQRRKMKSENNKK